MITTDVASRRKTLREVLKTSLPAVFDLSSQTIALLVEVIFIGHLSTAALAGVGISQQIILLTFTIILTFVVGSSIIVVRYLGAGDTWNANHILGQSLIVGVVLSIFISLIWYYGAPFILLLIKEKEPLARIYGAKYLTTIAFFTPFIITNFIALGIMRGAGDTMVTMKINIIINLLHVLLDAVLIFGLLGFPRLETRGAGLAVGIAHTTGFFITFYYLRSRKTSLFLAFMEITRPNFATFKRLIKAGIPTTVEQLIWSLGQLIMSIYAGWLGRTFLATHQVFVRLQSVLTMIFFGFSIGSMTLVGKNLGADHARQAKRTGRITGAVGLTVSIIIAVILYLFSCQLMWVFTNDQQVIAMGLDLMVILALIQLPKGINIVYSGNLRGSADLKWLMWLAVTTAISYEMIISWILAIPLGLGLTGLWLVQGIDESTRFLLNYWRFHRKKWKKFDL
jgi:putative MATE family efflux protein